MLSAEAVCSMLMLMSKTYFGIQTNNVDPDQTAPRGSQIWVCTVCFKDVLKGLTDEAQMTVTGSSAHQLARVNNEKNSRPRGYKTFFMLNSTEHEISTPHKTKMMRIKKYCFLNSLMLFLSC